MGCYAQTKVTEYVIGDFPDKGDRSYCLCVLNGDKGVLKFKNLNLVYQAEELRAYGNSIVLTSQNPNLYKDACMTFSGLYDMFAYNLKEDFVIVETRNIPKSDWNNKIASYGMTVSRNETAGINEEAAGKLVIGGLIVGLGSLVVKSIRDLSDDRGSSSSSSSSSSSNNNTNVDKTIRVNSKVKCYVWGPKQNSGWHGRVTEINGDKCSVYIDKIVVKGWTQTILNACEASGWKSLSNTESYSGNERIYGRGTIITVPKYYLEIDD